MSKKIEEVQANANLLIACKAAIALDGPFDQGVQFLQSIGYDHSNRFEVSATQFVENFIKDAIKKAELS